MLIKTLERKVARFLARGFLPGFPGFAHALPACSMALRTTSSSVQSMIGLRPRPGRVCKPLMLSAKKRFTQKLTDTCDISVCKPMALLEKPADLSNTAQQRIRKQWLEPFRKPASKDKSSESVNVIDLTLPIEIALRIIRQRYQIFMI